MSNILLHASTSYSGMGSHVSNEVMRRNNRTSRIDWRHLPTSAEAVRLYQEDGGRISDETHFGEDPISGDSTKFSIRMRAFTERFPSFDTIFENLVNGNPSLFENALLFYIDVSYRLSRS